MRIHALVVNVNYSDHLARSINLWLPAVTSLTVLTDMHDDVAAAQANEAGAWCYRTDAFYADGAFFNKAAAMNEAVRSMPWDDWIPVIQLAEDMGKPMFFSVFTEAAVDWCEKHGIGRYKIASADITHRPLIEHVAATGKPIVLSTGAAYLLEMTAATSWIGHRDVTLLACGLSYPCPPEAANLSRMKTMRSHFNVPVGYSDHTTGYMAMVRARYLEATMIEKHFTLTPDAGGDHDFAAIPHDIQLYHEYASWKGWAEYDGFAELAPVRAEQEARRYARRSIVVTQDMYDSQPLTRDCVDFLRPGTGIPPPVCSSSFAALGIVAPPRPSAYRLTIPAPLTTRSGTSWPAPGCIRIGVANRNGRVRLDTKHLFD